MNNEPFRHALFELRHLRYFVAVAEERNFGRAAERLGIAQPGLSQQIASLEKLVGTPLLDRSRRLFSLTLPGQAFLIEARKTLAQADAAVSAAHRAARGETGQISVGYVASAAHSGLLTGAIARFRSAHPEVELKLVEMEMTKQLALIAEGTLDVGFIRPPAPVPRTLKTQIIMSEPLAVALPASHKLASHPVVALRMLAEETFITPQQPAEMGFRRKTALACAEAGFDPSIEAIGRDFTTIVSMVAVGLGVALVPRSLDCLQLPGIVYRPVTKITTVSELAIAFRRNEASSVARAFIAHCREESAAAPNVNRPSKD